MSNALYIPPGVQVELDDIVQATGGEGKVRRLNNRKYQVLVSNDRVQVTPDLQTTSPGRWVWCGSTLQVDGQRRPRAHCIRELAQIFADPDSEPGPCTETAETTEPDPMPPSRPATEAPVVVAQQYHTLAGKLGDKVSLGGDDNAWVIGVDFDRGAIRMRFTCRRGDWTLDRRRPYQLVVDGRDRTREISNDIAKALAMLGGQRGDAAQTPPGVAQASGPARANSVEVRRSAVIRV